MIKYFALSMLTLACTTGYAMPSLENRNGTPQKNTNAKEIGIFKNLEKKGGSKMKAPESGPTITPVITEVEGKEQLCLKTSSGYYPFAGSEYFYEQTEAPSYIVYGTDGDIYIKDVLEYGYDTYIKGSVEGDKLIVDLPQTLFIEHFDWLGYVVDGNIYYNLGVFQKMEVDGSIGFELNKNIDQVVYSISEDGALTLELEEGYALGIMQYMNEYEEWDEEGNYNTEGPTAWYGGWGEFADLTQCFVPSDIELVTIPDGAETETWYYLYQNYGSPVTVAIIDDDFYIRGLSEDIPNLTFKGKINGDKVSIPQFQMIGIYDWENTFMITRCGYLKNNRVSLEPEDVEYVFNYDAEKKTLTSENPDLLLCVAYYEDSYVLIDFSNFEILFQDEFGGKPMNPYDLYWSDWLLDEFGFYSFFFTIPAVSTTGNILLPEDLYYEIYVNGELFTFEEYVESPEHTEYKGILEPTTEIPFDFFNEFDIDFYSHTDREIGFYIEGIETVGVRSVYKYKGDTTYSQQVYVFTNDQGSVDPIEDLSQPVSIEYFDLNGQKVTKDSKGVIVKRSILSDGNVRTRKIMRR